MLVKDLFMVPLYSKAELSAVLYRPYWEMFFLFLNGFYLDLCLKGDQLPCFIHIYLL